MKKIIFVLALFIVAGMNLSFAATSPAPIMPDKLKFDLLNKINSLEVQQEVSEVKGQKKIINFLVDGYLIESTDLTKVFGKTTRCEINVSFKYMGSSNDAKPTLSSRYVLSSDKAADGIYRDAYKLCMAYAPKNLKAKV